MCMMEGSSNVYLGGSSNGVLFLLQNFNITMAVGPGTSYWNKAM